MSDKTAWGKIHMKIEKATVNQTFPAALESIGILKEDSIGLTTEDGTTYELWGSGHELIDELKGEPTLKVTATILQVPEETRQKFWETETVGTGDDKKLRVKSMVNSEKWAVQFASLVVGSETFEAPYCSVSFKPLFEEKEGWTGEVEFTLLKGKAGYLFDFGVVPEPTAEG